MIVDVLGVTSGTHYDCMRELPLRYGKKVGHKQVEFFKRNNHVDLNSCAAALPLLAWI